MTRRTRMEMREGPKEAEGSWGLYATSDAKRAYNKQWRQNNPQKVKAYNDFWNKTPRVIAAKAAYENTLKRKSYKIEWYLKKKGKPVNRRKIAERLLGLQS